MVPTDIHLCLLETSSGCEQSEAVGAVFRQWREQQWVTSTGVDFYRHDILALVHHWQICIANGGDYVKNHVL